MGGFVGNARVLHRTIREQAHSYGMGSVPGEGIFDANKKGPPFGEPLSLNLGAGTRSRTRDLLITSQLLYQLSYTGVMGADYRDLVS